MPTYSFSRTREQLRDKIARLLGIAATGQTLNDEDADIILEGIALRLREMHARGIFWHNVAAAQTSVSLTGGQATASLSAVTDYLYPVSVMVDVGSDQQAVRIVDHREYQSIPDKTESGDPEVAHFAGSTVYLWPVPQSNGTMRLTYQAIAADTAFGTAVDMPLEFTRAFAVLVAHDLASDFDVSPQRLAYLASQVEQSKRDLYALNAQRVDASTVTTEYF